MTQEDRQLLFTDLCARLPYNVWVSYKTKYDDIERATILNGNYVRDIMEGTSSWIDFKPYLRPMSSMTEEEIIEFNNIPSTKNYTIIENDLPWQVAHYKQIDWLNKKMFDFRGLIPKGHAVKVTKDNNPYNNL